MKLRIARFSQNGSSPRLGAVVGEELVDLAEVLGADATTEAALAALPGVDTVTVASRAGDAWTYDVTTREGGSGEVQRAITGFGFEARLTLIGNSEETLDLETVFLRLIDQKEVAA